MSVKIEATAAHKALHRPGMDGSAAVALILGLSCQFKDNTFNNPETIYIGKFKN